MPAISRQGLPPATVLLNQKSSLGQICWKSAGIHIIRTLIKTKSINN